VATRADLLADRQASNVTVSHGAANVGGTRSEQPLITQLPPLDVRSINPIGFRRASNGRIGCLRPVGEGLGVEVDNAVLLRLPLSGAVSDSDVEALRPLDGMLVRRPARGVDLRAFVQTTACLAAGGIPLVLERPFDWRPLLGSPLTDILGAADIGDLADPLRREQHSIRARRYALATFGTEERWRSLTGPERLPLLGWPRVSAILCTRRPEMLRFALSNVTRQRGVEVQLVLGLHGIPRDHPTVVMTTSTINLEVRIVEVDRRRPLGEVLNAAAREASGSYIAKFDDDDWYGPDHLSDLVLSHRYSGCDLVGCQAEFVYLQELDQTVRRGSRSAVEVPASLTTTGMVTGGTMLLSRGLFEAIGGFKLVPLFEDGELCCAIQAAGGSVYRQHGLNYVYRRRAPSEHTWQAPNEIFFEDDPPIWPGLFLNDLMEGAA
jgi:hypothetical protein